VNHGNSIDKIGFYGTHTFNGEDVARYGQEFKERAVAVHVKIVVPLGMRRLPVCLDWMIRF
jgi:hypothetical protein